MHGFSDILKNVSTNAVKIFGLYPKKGVIAEGSYADIAIIDPNKVHGLNASDLHIAMDLSVYSHMKSQGWFVMTILRGKAIVEDEEYNGAGIKEEYLRTVGR